MNRLYFKLWLSCLSLFLSVGSFSAFAESVNIGGIFYGSGSAVQFPGAEHSGFETAQIAVDDLNLLGGIRGKHVNLLRYNFDSTPLGAARAAKQAVADGVIGVVGPSWSSHSIAAAKVLQKAKIPLITPTATNVKVTQIGDYVFRMCFIDPFQGEVMAQFATQDLGAKTAVVLTNSSRSYSRGLSQFFIQSFQKLGGKVLWEGKYLNDEEDFSSLVQEAQSFPSDVIFVPGGHWDSGRIIQTLKKAGSTATILGGDGWGRNMYEKFGDAMTGNYYSDSWDVNFNEKSKMFVKKYDRRISTWFATGPLTYDAVMLLADAAERAKSLDPQKIRDALAATKDFEGLGGKIQFDANRNPKKPAVILQFLKGKNASFLKTFETQ